MYFITKGWKIELLREIGKSLKNLWVVSGFKSIPLFVFQRLAERAVKFGTQSEEAKKQARAERFGAQSEDAKKQARAARYRKQWDFYGGRYNLKM